MRLAGDQNIGAGRAYLVGDATLDGTVDGLDYIAWNDHKFSPLPVVCGWCEGNFNADGAVDGLDFILWNENKFTSADGVSAVPEPSAGVLLFIAVICLGALVGPPRRATP